MVYNEDLFVDQLAMVALKSGWEKFNIIGFSLGGAITAGFVSRFPEHVEKIALVAPVGIMKVTQVNAEISPCSSADENSYLWQIIYTFVCKESNDPKSAF